MMRSSKPTARTIVLMAILLTIAACGADGATVPTGLSTVEPATDVQAGDTTVSTPGSSGGGEVGPLAHTADPGQAWAEVDGQRLVYEAPDSQHYTCEVSTDQILINYQTADGHDFNLQASLQPDGWIGNLNFRPGGGGTNVTYGAAIGFDPGTLGLGERAVSYEGTVARVEDFEVQNAQDVNATLAVNCESPGGDPTAEIGDQGFVFPFSGAQSIDCEVSDEVIEVIINRLSADDLQLQISARDDGVRWVGNVSVIASGANYVSTIPEDGSGLTIDGATVAYEGTFSGPDGEMEGSVSVACS